MNKTTKKVPLRQCVGCLLMKPKKEMLRIVHTPEGAFVLDRTGKVNGRGAYICNCKDCFLAASKKKGLDRSFKMSVPKEAYDTLLKEFEETNE